jgi:hypothetical protein
MAPISRIARSDLPQTAVIQPLRMPQGKPTVEKLSMLATGMAQAAIPFSAVFIAAGLPTDFIARLEAAAAAMESSVDDREQSRGRRNGATKGLKSKLAAGRKIVHILDAFVNTALKDDLPLLAHWDAIKRVQLVGRSASPKTGTQSNPLDKRSRRSAATPTFSLNACLLQRREFVKCRHVFEEHNVLST